MRVLFKSLAACVSCRSIPEAIGTRKTSVRMFLTFLQRRLAEEVLLLLSDLLVARFSMGHGLPLLWFRDTARLDGPV